MKISTEEAFASPSLMAEWKKLIDDGNPNEAGLEQMIGAILNPVSDWEAMLQERLPELGPLRIQAMDESGVDIQLADKGLDPSLPAYRLPQQGWDDSNHAPLWSLF